MQPEMQHLGCGFNGFGQLLPREKKQRILYFVRLFSDLQKDRKSNPDMPDVGNIDEHDHDDEFMSTTVPNLENFTLSWSTLYIHRDSKIWLQGFNNEKRAQIKTLDLSSNDSQSSIRSVEASGEMLFCTKMNEKCSVLNSRTCQELLVKGPEQTSFTQVFAGDMNVVALTDVSAGSILHENETYIFRPFACAASFSHVSCGKEHVLLLSKLHQVYSFGLGSRGQLGHGTTDGETEPRLLEALEMVAMAMINAGGWHSAAVSTIGDLYMWGWNEAGQLGFSQEKHPPSSSQAQQGETKIGMKKKWQEREDKNGSTAKKSCVKSLETSSNVAESYSRSEILPQTDLTVEAASTTSICQGQANVSVSFDDDCNRQEGTFCESLEDHSQLTGVQSCDSGSALDLRTERQEDDVLFQALPRILDLPEGKDILKVSCGSRHTAAISEDNRLCTWGWGAYGQLGHGDTNSRDEPTLVESLHSNQRVKVTDVLCGAWNTLVTTSNN